MYIRKIYTKAKKNVHNANHTQPMEQKIKAGELTLNDK